MTNALSAQLSNTYVSLCLFALIISLYVLLIYSGKELDEGITIVMYALLAPFATGLLVFIALDAHSSLKLFLYCLIVIGSLFTIAALLFLTYLYASYRAWKH